MFNPLCLELVGDMYSEKRLRGLTDEWLALLRKISHKFKMKTFAVVKDF